MIRGANDRLLTDRELDDHIIGRSGLFVYYTNQLYRLIRDAGGDVEAQEAWSWVGDVQYGAGRAPLELIAHIASKDLPYTDILTADYIMANPMAAEAYGADTAFEDPENLNEFRPSEIVSYYRDGDSKQTRVAYDKFTVIEVTDAGDLATDYPHAGILNTTVFLRRYPSTATNRNRARSRWTYYHFLGLDVEKSASRTTDPVALADTNNPTMHNPACTVCHGVLDPVAGAFQNYGDVGFYRDQWGGMDSLDGFYKEDYFVASETHEIDAPRYTPRVITVGGALKKGKEKLRLNLYFDPPRGEGDDVWWHPAIDHVKLRDSSGKVVQHLELQNLIGEMEGLCGDRPDHAEDYYVPYFCGQEIILDVPADGNYEVELVAWFDSEQSDGVERRRLMDVILGGYVEGDSWYRDMRTPGFADEASLNAERSVQWLADKVVADDRFAEAAVKFWWPAIMGRDVAEPPAEGDPDFDGRLLASNVQTADVARLAAGFRRGFHGAKPYNLKDLLVELVLSRWFRASRVVDANPIRAIALRGSGAKRLLTPEELARKTVALTGFDWQRSKLHDPTRGAANWTNVKDGYGLLYGGIDSDGITKRGRDLTPLMVGVAQRVATATSCPVVMKDFFLVDEEDRRLLGGIDLGITPTFEFGATHEISATSQAKAETVAASGLLSQGSAAVTLSFVNNEEWFDGIDGDRILRIDRLVLRDANGHALETHELVHATNARGCEWNGPEDDHMAFYCEGSIDVVLDIPADGQYDIEVRAWADQYGDELAMLEVSVGSGTERSLGSRTIKAKLAELHEVLLGVKADESSPDVQTAYDLFVDVWSRERESGGGDFRGLRCDYLEDHQYFDGIADDLWSEEPDEYGNPNWDWERVEEFIWQETKMEDPHYLARTWVTVLAFLMTDYRYLHL